MVEAQKKSGETDPTKRDWAAEVDDDEEVGDQAIGQEPKTGEEVKQAAKAEEVPEKKVFAAPVSREKNRYGDFVVKKINVKDPRDKRKPGEESKKEEEEDEEEEEESSDDEPEEEEKGYEAETDKSKS